MPDLTVTRFFNIIKPYILYVNKIDVDEYIFNYFLINFSFLLLTAKRKRYRI